MDAKVVDVIHDEGLFVSSESATRRHLNVCLKCVRGIYAGRSISLDENDHEILGSSNEDCTLILNGISKVCPKHAEIICRRSRSQRGSVVSIRDVSESGIYVAIRNIHRHVLDEGYDLVFQHVLPKQNQDDYEIDNGSEPEGETLQVLRGKPASAEFIAFHDFLDYFEIDTSTKLWLVNRIYYWSFESFKRYMDQSPADLVLLPIETRIKLLTAHEDLHYFLPWESKSRQLILVAKTTGTILAYIGWTAGTYLVPLGYSLQTTILPAIQLRLEERQQIREMNLSPRINTFARSPLAPIPTHIYELEKFKPDRNLWSNDRPTTTEPPLNLSTIQQNIIPSLTYWIHAHCSSKDLKIDFATHPTIKSETIIPDLSLPSVYSAEPIFKNAGKGLPIILSLLPRLMIISLKPDDILYSNDLGYSPRQLPYNRQLQVQILDDSYVKQESTRTRIRRCRDWIYRHPLQCMLETSTVNPPTIYTSFTASLRKGNSSIYRQLSVADITSISDFIEEPSISETLCQPSRRNSP